MLKRLRSRLHGEGGFTLIELLVVILIIGILAAIAIPSFLSQKSKGAGRRSKSAARTAQTAMETYYTDAGDYNTTVAAMKISEPSLTQLTSISPSNGTTNADATGTISNSYRVWVTGADGRKFGIDQGRGRSSQPHLQRAGQHGPGDARAHPTAPASRTAPGSQLSQHRLRHASGWLRPPALCA